MQVSYHSNGAGVHAAPSGHGYHLHHSRGDTLGRRDSWRFIGQLCWTTASQKEGERTYILYIVHNLSQSICQKVWNYIKYAVVDDQICDFQLVEILPQHDF